MAVQGQGAIGQILTKVKGGMAYTNLFSITMPKSNLSDSLQFRGKGSQLPSSEVGVMEIPYRGRKLKVPAQRSFSEWTVTVMETKSMEVRSKFEEWMDELDGSDTGLRNPDQLIDITVHLLNGNGSKAISFTLYGAFPTSIGAIDLSFDEQTAPLEYQVTFNYSYHKMIKGLQSSGSGGK